jgi:HEAT repeat protein
MGRMRGIGKTGRKGGMGRIGGMVKAFLPLAMLSLHASPALPAHPAPSASAAQVPFEQATRDLASSDAGTRLKAAQMLKEAGYPEAAVPLAALVTDPADEVQLEAIAAELNIFLEERIVPRKRIGFVIEVRNQVLAESAFSSGPLAIGAKPVPSELLTALRTASRDEQPRVALEAIYAFGVLAVEPSGEARRELLRTSGPALAALLGVPDPGMRFAAVRVIGRVFAPRVHDGPIEELLGDAVITALNDPDRAVKSAAMESLGLLRYARGVQALTELFQYYGKGEPAEAALDAIARVAYGASAPLFTSQLTAKSAALRGIAAEGLARLGDASQLPAIQSALASERGDSLLLIGAFASAMLSNVPLTPIAEALTRPRLRDQAYRYLVELAPGRSSLFTQQLQDPDPRVRTDVIDVLALAGDAAALPLVERLLTDRDAQVVKAAERAVARLRALQRKPIS